jgi:hypothetical protein
MKNFNCALLPCVLSVRYWCLQRSFTIFSFLIKIQIFKKWQKWSMYYFNPWMTQHDSSRINFKFRHKGTQKITLGDVMVCLSELPQLKVQRSSVFVNRRQHQEIPKNTAEVSCQKWRLLSCVWGCCCYTVKNFHVKSLLL